MGLEIIVFHKASRVQSGLGRRKVGIECVGHEGSYWRRGGDQGSRGQTHQRGREKPINESKLWMKMP